MVSLGDDIKLLASSSTPCRIKQVGEVKNPHHCLKWVGDVVLGVFSALVTLQCLMSSISYRCPWFGRLGNHQQ